MPHYSIRERIHLNFASQRRQAQLQEAVWNPIQRGFVRLLSVKGAVVPFLFLCASDSNAGGICPTRPNIYLTASFPRAFTFFCFFSVSFATSITTRPRYLQQLLQRRWRMCMLPQSLERERRNSESA